MLLRCAEPRRRLARARSPLSAPAAGGRGAPRDRARPRAGGARAKRPSPRSASHHIGLRPSSTTAAARGSPVGPATPPEIERQAGARSLAFLFSFSRAPRAASRLPNRRRASAKPTRSRARPRNFDPKLRSFREAALISSAGRRGTQDRPFSKILRFSEPSEVPRSIYHSGDMLTSAKF